MSKVSNGLDVCDVIFNSVERPEGFHSCKSINLFEDRYRVNVYAHRVINDMPCVRIADSYFISYNKDNHKVKILGGLS